MQRWHVLAVGGQIAGRGRGFLDGCLDAPGATKTSARSARTYPADGGRPAQREGARTGAVIKTRGVGADPHGQKRAEERSEGVGHEDRQGNHQRKKNQSGHRGSPRIDRRADPHVGVGEALQQDPPEQ